MGLLKSKKEVFSSSGPSYLTHVDWTDMQHKRTIMASLVQGVYILERDRQKYRYGNEAFAPAWWESFNFHLNDDDILKDGSNIFAAIFRFKHSASPDASSSTSSSSFSSSSSSSSSSCSFSNLENAPQYVVAFRGTILKRKSIVKDLYLDATCSLHTLHHTSRFDIGLDVVKELVRQDLSSATKVWLAGHSLGSAIAMLVGKNMVFEGYPPLETYLFNSPFPSPPIESVKIGAIRDGLRVASSVLKVGTALVSQAISSEKHPIITNDTGMFHKLSQSGWIPYLFVNQDDMVCSGFIGYFERRKAMKDIGAEAIEKLSMQISRVSLFTSKILRTDTEPLHVLPSATIVISSVNGPTRAHDLEQWYHHDLQCDSKVYLVDEMLEINSLVNLTQLPSNK